MRACVCGWLSRIACRGKVEAERASELIFHSLTARKLSRISSSSLEVSALEARLKRAAKGLPLFSGTSGRQDYWPAEVLFGSKVHITPVGEHCMAVHG
jgi:hypothetical protein